MTDLEYLLYGLKELKAATLEDAGDYEKQFRKPSEVLRAFYTGYISAISAVEGMIDVIKQED